MNSIRYALLHLRRHLKTAAMTVLCYAAILAMILFIQKSMISRQQTLETMAKSIPITGALANSQGSQTELLEMDPSYPMLFLQNHFLSALVKDVQVKSVMPCYVGDGGARLIGITSPAADSALRFEGAILYNEGYDDAIWMSEEAVCVISPEYEAFTYRCDDEHIYLDVLGHFYRASYKDFAAIRITLRVIGMVTSRETLYCPYLTLQNNCARYPGVSFLADNLSFTVKDNGRLDELRDRAKIYFGDSSLQNAGSAHYTLILKDAEYLKLTGEARKNLEILHLLQPVMYLCALGSGGVLTALQMRARKKELAVLRSLGAGKGRIAAQCMLEYALLCLPVTALVFLLPIQATAAWGVYLAFIAGCASVLIRLASIPLIRQIRELEE